MLNEPILHCEESIDHQSPLSCSGQVHILHGGFASPWVFFRVKIHTDFHTRNKTSTIRDLTRLTAATREMCFPHVCVCLCACVRGCVHAYDTYWMKKCRTVGKRQETAATPSYKRLDTEQTQHVEKS